MNIAEKVKELQNVSCIGIRENKLDWYSEFYEFELDNNEFILVNNYLYQGRKINDVSETFWEDEGFIILNESVIDKVQDDMFWDDIESYRTQDGKELIDKLYEHEKEYVELYNQYIDVIKYCFDVYNATDDFSE